MRQVVSITVYHTIHTMPTNLQADIANLRNVYSRVYRTQPDIARKTFNFS